MLGTIGIVYELIVHWIWLLDLSVFSVLSSRHLIFLKLSVLNKLNAHIKKIVTRPVCREPADDEVTGGK